MYYKRCKTCLKIALTLEKKSLDLMGSAGITSSRGVYSRLLLTVEFTPVGYPCLILWKAKESL